VNADRLRRMVTASPWLTRVLATVRGSGLPDAWVGAGTVRDLVWGELYGSGFDPDAVRDVDVVYFDPADLGRARDDAATELLRDAWPAVPWEARNRAAVHTWYADRFGGEPVPPFASVAEAVATWPETATAVAVRLAGAGDVGGDVGGAVGGAVSGDVSGDVGEDAGGEVEVCAPLGLDDLFAGVWRRNPRRVSLAESRARLARHRPAERWPGVRVIPPG